MHFNNKNKKIKYRNEIVWYLFFERNINIILSCPWLYNICQHLFISNNKSNDLM